MEFTEKEKELLYEIGLTQSSNMNFVVDVISCYKSNDTLYILIYYTEEIEFYTFDEMVAFITETLNNGLYVGKWQNLFR